MTQDLDWVDLFDEAYKNALIHGTGFIKITVNSPKGLEMSVVSPADYHYLGEKVPAPYESSVGHMFGDKR
jgi:hypothetical protein